MSPFLVPPIEAERIDQGRNRAEGRRGGTPIPQTGGTSNLQRGGTPILQTRGTLNPKTGGTPIPHMAGHYRVLTDTGSDFREGDRWPSRSGPDLRPRHEVRPADAGEGQGEDAPRSV